MKRNLSMVLGFVCVVLVAAIIVLKLTDTVQHKKDASAAADLSSQLTSAQERLAACNKTLITLSNSLGESQTATVEFSNYLDQAVSAITFDLGQITNLMRRVMAVESEKQTLGRRVMDLTNQVADLTRQIAPTEAGLDQANIDLTQAKKNYALLEDCFRKDVAARVAVEQKFNNLSELQAQMHKLKKHPAEEVSTESIYKSLNVEVKPDNSFFAVPPD